MFGLSCYKICLSCPFWTQIAYRKKTLIKQSEAVQGQPVKWDFYKSQRFTSFVYYNTDVLISAPLLLTYLDQ